MILHSIKRAYLRATIAAVSAFDVGVEALIRDFIALDSGLDRFVDKQSDEIDRLLDEVNASFDRQHAAVTAETDVREAVYNRVDEVSAEQTRALRIKDAIQKIVNA